MKELRSGLPSAAPTKPFWQTPPDPQLENYKSEIFPEDVDIVIIGSGFTGAMIAYNLLSRPGPKPSILMLEARTAASGATGRNGGHIKPDCCRGFDEYTEFHGVETALKQCHLEAANLEATVDFIRKNDLVEQVDLVTCNTVDAYMSEGKWAWGFKSFNNFKNAGGDVSQITVFHGEDAKKFTRLPGCHGAISYPAASLWPYKLTIAIISMSLKLGLNLQTNTAVTACIPSQTPGQWTVVTAARHVNARKVFHATNGYSSYLLPELTGRIIPLKGHVAAIPPSKEYEKKPLETTMGFFWDSASAYLIQRKANGKHLILGGRDLEHPGGLSGPLGDSDDSVICDSVTKGLEKFPEEQFEGWLRSDNHPAPDTQAWTGIMAISKDCIPFLGELPGKKGQYIAAGYHGHGMARIFLSVKALCEFVCGDEVDSRVPAVYFDLEARLKDEIDLVKTGWMV